MFLLCAIIAAVLTRAADIRTVSPEAASGEGVAFELEGTVIWQASAGTRWHVFLRDESGLTPLHDYLPPGAPRGRRGDRIRAAGHVLFEHGGVFPHMEKVEILGHDELEPPVRTSIKDLLRGENADRRITIRGTVDDVFTDEIDANWVYLAVSEDGKSIYLPITTGFKDPDSLLGAVIEADGIFFHGINVGMRQNIGRLFRADARPRVVVPSAKGVFDAEPLGDVRQLDPAAIAALGRRKVRGTVLAAWQTNRVLLKDDDGQLHRLDLVSGPPPANGAFIEAVGLPVTDLYRTNLTRVRWRTAEGAAAPVEKPVAITMKELFSDARGQPRISPELHGRRVSVRGTVRALPSTVSAERRLLLENDGFQLPVDVPQDTEDTDGLTEGCQIEVTGICITEIANWQPDQIFPAIAGLVIVPGPADSITVLSRPSWWTPGRLLAVIGALIAVLFGAALWNVSLRTLAERRGRELNEETIARATADLKVLERTRLAVELHDSIAQNLTGVSLEIRTANRLAAVDPAGMKIHLETAGRTLESCRLELRNCLWDLRHQALEQNDMNVAIRQTLAPILGSRTPAVNIRFAVSRELLTDNTAHAILRIIRELVSNALRHGEASEIRIAGTTENGKLLFSVSDNGRGFDPASAPGSEEGHFGLEGIRERLAAFNGNLSLDSTPGHGTRAVVSVDLPQ